MNEHRKTTLGILIAGAVSGLAWILSQYGIFTALAPYYEAGIGFEGIGRAILAFFFSISCGLIIGIVAGTLVLKKYRVARRFTIALLAAITTLVLVYATALVTILSKLPASVPILQVVLTIGVYFFCEWYVNRFKQPVIVKIIIGVLVVVAAVLLGFVRFQ